MSTPEKIHSREELHKQMVQLLTEENRLTAEQLREIRQRALWLKQPLESLLLKEGCLDEFELVHLLCRVLDVPRLKAQDIELNPVLQEQVPAKAVVNYRLLPVRMRNGTLVLATDRFRESAEEEHLRVLLGYPIQWMLCTGTELQEYIKHYYGVGIETLLKVKETAGRKRESRTGTEHEEHDTIPALVQEIIQDAVQVNATDIHFEPTPSQLSIRYRVDGVLYETPAPEAIHTYAKAIISAIKIMAQMNIAERRVPQDGRFSVTLNQKMYDIRVSVLPSTEGETANLRILNREAGFLSLNELHLPEQARNSLEHLIQQPYGIVLFTGPTGSGKTTSLYAALDYLNDRQQKIITIEDPVEYQIKGITQMQVRPETGFTFSSGLRSILRHDPDVILVGEIRDRETADIAVSAAMTGHLVFSTLHTNDSAGAATRLVEMGVEPYLIASGLQGVIAQRLMRNLCKNCRTPDTPEPAVLQELKKIDSPAEPPQIYAAAGCPHCRFTGYAGRSPIYEALVMDQTLRPLILERAASDLLMQAARRNGLQTLREAAWKKVLAGESSVAELMRVTRRPSSALKAESPKP
jgi:type II secretory ATPase GspE/PulE/Tfp pilus assembly ATPase PilB-like protein